MTMRTLFTGVLAAGLTAGVLVAQSGAGQQHQHQTPPDPAAPAAMKAMMAHCEQMMADMKAADARLDSLAAAMTSARGEAKVAAMEALLSALVQERKRGMGSMMQMHGRMMAGMMDHMMTGMTPEMHGAMKEMMARCPMMKGGGARP